LPIVAVTAYAMQGDRERILDSGFDGYLSKPINPSSLTEELNRLLTKQAIQPPHSDRPDEKQGEGKASNAVGSGT
jgi:two-component system cell cycle response regulator